MHGRRLHGRSMDKGGGRLYLAASQTQSTLSAVLHVQLVSNTPRSEELDALGVLRMKQARDMEVHAWNPHAAVKENAQVLLTDVPAHLIML